MVSPGAEMGVIMNIAVVTGASSGMGREMVMELADRFSALEEIWVIARRKERLSELQKLVPVRLRIFPLDLSAPASWSHLREALKEHNPHVRILVNSSGFGKIGRVGDLSLEDETGMVRLNCEALCAVTHLMLPFMRRNGRIIQFASSAAFLPQPKFAVYAATKSFVLSYSRALGAELRAKGIYVTAVCPGPVRTEFFDIAETTGQIPLYKRLVMAKPDKVVKKALRDSMQGKTVSVYGTVMKLFWAASKLTPHSWGLAVLTRGAQKSDC